MENKKQLQFSEECGRIKTNQGRVICPECGFLLARIAPGASAYGLLLYCRKCRKQIPVNIPEIEP